MGTRLLLCFEPCHVSHFRWGGGQVGMCLFIFLRMFWQAAREAVSQAPVCQAAITPTGQQVEDIDFLSLLPSGFACLPGLWGVAGVMRAFVCVDIDDMAVCEIWTSMGSMCNCQEYQSQFESVTVVNAYLLACFLPAQRRIGMCINSFKIKYVKYSHKVE